MRNQKRKSPAIDATDHTILITGGKWGWREVHDDRNGAWYGGGRHLKTGQDDPEAAKSAVGNIYRDHHE